MVAVHWWGVGIMAVSESLKKAQKKYRKSVKVYKINLTTKNDTYADVINVLDNRSDKTAYIVGLIRKDMKHD